MNARGYAQGRTSWGGYLAATGKQDRKGDRETVAQLRQQAAVDPNSLLGRTQRVSSLRTGCMLLCDPDVYEAFGCALKEISRLTLPVVLAGYEALFKALNQAAESETVMTIAEMLECWRAGAATAETA